MSRAFLIDKRTGEVSQIQIEGDDGVRRYFDPADDIYGRTLGEKLDDGSVVRVWRTRDKARHLEAFTAHNLKTMEAVDLLELPAAVRVGLEVKV